MHASYIQTLKKLDEMHMDIIQSKPFPITYDDKTSEQIRLITENKKLVVKALARSLGMICRDADASEMFPFAERVDGKEE